MIQLCVLVKNKNPDINNFILTCSSSFQGYTLTEGSSAYPGACSHHHTVLGVRLEARQLVASGRCHEL